MTKYYLDACIWIDLYEDRKGYRGEPLGTYALKLFSMIKSGKMKIIITDLLLTELELNYSIEEINGMMKPFDTERILSSKIQREEAVKLAKKVDIPKGDALHAIIARDNDLILVTRDKHFKLLKDISISYKPEDII